jgi:PRTRC genetic system protein B
MNKLTRMMSESYTPKLAIVVYECSDPAKGTYLERRDIRNGAMGAGTPLTKKCLTDIMAAIALDNDSTDFGIHGPLPENLLYADCTPGKMRLVWYNPPRQRQVYFSKDIGIEDGTMYVPGLLYVASEGSLKMYAFKGSKPKARLFRAPFMNVSDKSVCLGNAKVQKPSEITFSNLIAYWEEMFWRSEFSHILGENPVRGNLATLTKRLIKSGEKFPNDVLLPVSVTLKSFLQ